MRLNRLLSGLAASSLVLALCAHAAAWSGAMWVRTPSIPRGLYWRVSVDAAGLVPGAYVCLPGLSRSAPETLRVGILRGILPTEWRQEPLVKKVAAVGGTTVAYVPRLGVTLDGKPLPASAVRSTDSQGRALPMPAYPLVLKPGQLWLASENEMGFDSRYFGPVLAAALSCIARPVWTF